MFNDYIEVKYTYYTTYYTIARQLHKLASRPIMSLDFEAQSIYTLDERAEAKELVKKHQDELSSADLRLSKVVARASGLSHPSITKMTHCIFGLSEDESIIFVITDPKVEELLMDFIVNFEGKLVLHNATFDLKLVHHRTGRFPRDFDDTQLLSRCLINHTQDWQCKTGLKHIMGEYYDPRWTLIESYDIQDFKDKDFLRYCSIDGSATIKLWYDLQEHIKEN